MIIAPTRASALRDSGRLDARYFVSPAVRLRATLASSRGLELRQVADYASVWAPGRFKRTYAVSGEDFVSYLRPYDVFEFLPPEADRLSATRTENLDDYRIRRGDLLQTISGRNLGPLTAADDYLARFALSHDMARITIDDEDDRYYTLAFLMSPTGQHLIRGDLSGSVIDHITPEQVGALQVPFVDSLHTDVAKTMSEAVRLREAARLRLHSLVSDFAGLMPDTELAPPLRQGWTLQAADLRGRLDAGYHNPSVASFRTALRSVGGVRVDEVADTFIPGRYTRYYVDSAHGRPIVSGRQLLQAWPINLRYIAARSFDFSAYMLEEDMVAFGAEGRAEERIGQPALIMGDRAGWLANNHVMRVRPRPGVDSGWLYLALAVPQVQAQVKASSCGSVVDAVYPPDLNAVLLPTVDSSRGADASQCWRDFAKASELEGSAIRRVERVMQQLMSAAA